MREVVTFCLLRFQMCDVLRRVALDRQTDTERETERGRETQRDRGRQRAERAREGSVEMGPGGGLWVGVTGGGARVPGGECDRERTAEARQGTESGRGHSGVVSLSRGKEG